MTTVFEKENNIEATKIQAIDDLEHFNKILDKLIEGVVQKSTELHEFYGNDVGEVDFEKNLIIKML